MGASHLEPLARTPIRILVCDDHKLMLEGLRAMVSSTDDIVIVGEAEDGAEALRLMEDVKPDIVLMDLKMPQMNGFDAIAQLKRIAPDTPVIVLTAYMNQSDIYGAVSEGASGYLLKGSTSSEIFAAIRQAATENKPPVSNEIGPVLYEISQTPPAEGLDELDIKILQMQAEGYSRQDIADDLGWNIGKIRIREEAINERWGVDGRGHASSIAIQRGIVRVPDPTR